MRSVALLVAALAPSDALRLAPPTPTTTRRGALGLAAATAFAPPNAASASVKYVVPIDDNLKLLMAKARQVRGSVRSGAAARRNLPMDPTPGVNNYGAPSLSTLRLQIAHASL